MNANLEQKLCNFLCLSEIMHKLNQCVKQSSTNIFLFFSNIFNAISISMYIDINIDISFFTKGEMVWKQIRNTRS